MKLIAYLRRYFTRVLKNWFGDNATVRARQRRSELYDTLLIELEHATNKELQLILRVVYKIKRKTRNDSLRLTDCRIGDMHTDAVVYSLWALLQDDPELAEQWKQVEQACEGVHSLLASRSP
jgi:hypothetical protein